MRHRSLLLLWLCASVLSTMTCFAADPSGYGQAGGEFDIKIPRVPSGELATAKALLEVSPDYRTTLKGFGLLTRDARKVERKKIGLKKSRKGPRFSKR